MCPATDTNILTHQSYFVNKKRYSCKSKKYRCVSISERRDNARRNRKFMSQDPPLSNTGANYNTADTAIPTRQRSHPHERQHTYSACPAADTTYIGISNREPHAPKAFPHANNALEFSSIIPPPKHLTEATPKINKTPTKIMKSRREITPQGIPAPTV